MLVPSGNSRDSESLIVETVEKAIRINVVNSKNFVKVIRNFEASNKAITLNA
jgi:hypothetical protein